MCLGKYISVHWRLGECSISTKSTEYPGGMPFMDELASTLVCQNLNSKWLLISYKQQGTIGEWVRCNADHYIIGKNDTVNYAYDVSSTLANHRNFTKKNCRALIIR